MTDNAQLTVENGVLTKIDLSARRIDVPPTVSEVNPLVFKDSSAIEVHFDKSCPMQISPTGTFSHCDDLKIAEFSESLIKICSGAFLSCHNLQCVYIPASVLNIEDDAFIDCGDEICIIGEKGSVAERYANANKILFRELQYYRTQPPVRTRVFNIFGETVTCSDSVNVYLEAKSHYGDPKYQKTVSNMLKEAVPKKYNSTKAADALDVIGKIYTQFKDRLKKHGITVTDDELDTVTLQPRAGALNIIKQIYETIIAIKSDMKENISNKVSSLRREVDRNVTGLGYGVIGDTFDILLHEFNNMQAKAEQRGKYTAIAEGKLADYKAQQNDEANSAYKKALDMALPALQTLSENLLGTLYIHELRILSKAHIIDLSVVTALDQNKAEELFNSAITKKGDTKLIFAMAIQKYPYDPKYSFEAIHRGYVSDELTDMIEFLGIKKEVDAGVKKLRAKYVDSLAREVTSLLADTNKFNAKLDAIKKELNAAEMDTVFNFLTSTLTEMVAKLFKTTKVNQNDDAKALAVQEISKTVSAQNWDTVKRERGTVLEIDINIPLAVEQTYEKLITCLTNAIASKQNTSLATYNEACAKLESSSTVEEFENLIAVFKGLNGFSDSLSMIERANFEISELRYAEACKIFDSAVTVDDYRKAIELFNNSYYAYNSKYNSTSKAHYNDCLAKTTAARTRINDLKLEKISNGIKANKSKEALLKAKKELEAFDSSYEPAKEKIKEIDKSLKSRIKRTITLAITIPIAIAALVLLFIFVIRPNSMKNSGDFATYNQYIQQYEIEEFVIPEGTTEIPAGAFADCRTLRHLTIPSTVKKIGSDAFKDCRSLSVINIADIKSWCEIEFADSYANPLYSRSDYNHPALYMNGSPVYELVIPDGVAKINDHAFAHYEDLRSVTFSDSVTTIGKSAFLESGISTVHFGKNVEKICAGAFMYTHLSDITIPSSVKVIEQNAFSYIDNLYRVNIDSIESWFNISFENNDANPLSNNASLYLNETPVTEAIFPEGITEVPAFIYSGCKSIVSVNIPGTVTTIGEHAFSNCPELETVVMNSGVKTLGEYAFCACDNLENVTLSDTLTSIEGGAFYNSGPYSGITINIPASVKWIGKYAFNDANLKAVVFEQKDGWYSTSEDTPTNGRPLNISTNISGILKNTYDSLYRE